MKRSYKVWAAAAALIVGGNVAWWAIASARAEETASAKTDSYLPVTCKDGESHEMGMGYAGLAIPGTDVSQAIDNYITETEGAVLTARDYSEVTTSTAGGLDVSKDGLARLFVDSSGRSALYLVQVDDQWRVDAAVACASFSFEEQI
jgi:hypothetical protein